MARLTITLTDSRHRALKLRAARTGKTIGELIEESLEHAGIAPEETVEEILARAGRNSGLSTEEAERLAVGETRAHRDGR